MVDMRVALTCVAVTVTAMAGPAQGPRPVVRRSHRSGWTAA